MSIKQYMEVILIKPFPGIQAASRKKGTAFL